MPFLKINTLLPLLLLSLSMPVYAQNSLNLGVLLNATGWRGDNGAGNSDFNSDKGGQFGLSASFSRDKFYTGLSLQGGEYTFDNSGPTQFSSGGAVSTTSIKVEHNDFDLLAGYYFWPQVSLFLDLKSVNSRWKNNGYEQGFSGLGIGVAGYNPLNDNWTLYGSLGFVGGTIKEENNAAIGDAGSSALIVGFNYALDGHNHINLGLKSRNYVFDYDDGNQQEYSLNGLFFGYNHVFGL